MALHSQRRNRDVRRSSGGFLAVWGRVLASLGMVMSALVGITVATQSAASALTFGPDNFMDISGSIRYDGIGTAGWANGPEAAADLLPTGTSGADLTTCSTPVGGIHAPGTNGIFDSEPRPRTRPLPAPATGSSPTPSLPGSAPLAVATTGSTPTLRSPTISPPISTAPLLVRRKTASPTRMR